MIPQASRTSITITLIHLTTSNIYNLRILSDPVIIVIVPVLLPLSSDFFLTVLFHIFSLLSIPSDGQRFTHSPRRSFIYPLITFFSITYSMGVCLLMWWISYTTLFGMHGLLLHWLVSVLKGVFSLIFLHGNCCTPNFNFNQCLSWIAS
mgnify:CR=1 FL=1